MKPAALRVVVADDQPEVRALLVARLRRCGFAVIEVEDGQELLEELAAHETDLVISDLNMPRLNGLEALGGLRRTNWVTPFILMTGFGDEPTHLEAMRLGATHVFHKPLDFKFLIATAHQIVAH